MSNFSIVEGGKTIDRRALLAGAAGGLAALFPGQARGQELLKPSVFVAGGKRTTILDFAPGQEGQRYYVITAPDGLKVFNPSQEFDNPSGNIVGGKVKYLFGAQHGATSIGVQELGCGGIFPDVQYVNGEDYEELMAREMRRIPPLQRLDYSTMGMLLTRDTMQKGGIPDSLDWSVDRGIREALLCPPKPTAGPAVSGPLPSPAPGPSTISGCPVSWEEGGTFTARGIPPTGVRGVDYGSFRTNNLRSGPDLIPPMGLFYAEPGGLLVGPEFPQSTVTGSGGAINYRDGQNQQTMNDAEFSGLVSPDGFALIHLEEGNLTFRNGGDCFSVSLPQRTGRNRFLFGIKGDPAQGNQTVVVDGYPRGNALYQRYDHAARISADGVNDLTNKAFEGTDKVTLIGLDLKTRAMFAAERSKGGAWKWINGNYT